MNMSSRWLLIPVGTMNSKRRLDEPYRNDPK